ncbi:tryptophanyl-tRNA synthetase [Desulfarculus baarsii DSM 2075]|uniref:Tryptophan--tRNA ligase n=1 Tax=Desulfarculus baarsii (strain ATCC 33931 / DSM 2075 / LMG 7858 / VKM B-1802 / 2st14) TaxID=644282 RepID=E1QI75_DESB2|nr:tryptophan--tRNA ligase [Desulfarculus baarsii]ADK85392.1 tryptophanyl-tRNA synthetase [Desulfarculus baarsii DSM 2075]
MRVLSGVQPSGTLHIGNYFAMMKRMIQYQNEHTLFCFIVNYHALTTVGEPDKLRQGALNAAMDFLALGLDPAKCYFWMQSDIPEVCELTWILFQQTPVGLLERAHSYKDKLAKGFSPQAGLFNYPVLMAADILMFQSEAVPVGKDQKQHIEITRDIAIKFNNQYGEVFTLPEPWIDDDTATVPGIDGQKMSKSYDNTLEIFLPEKQLRKKIMSIVTDSTPVEAPKDPEKCNVYKLISLFMTAAEREELAQRYRAGGLGYGQVKKELFERMWAYFAPYRDKRAALAADPEEVRRIMAQGAQKARALAMETIDKVRRAVGLNY